MSTWRDERNAQALARLTKALPPVFPAPVLTHALARSLIPPLPRLAVESYWRTHPVRADRLARALAARTGQPPGWTWRLSGLADDGLPRSFRAPPAPFREQAFALGPGQCCVCGQPVFRLGWHVDLWGDGKPNRRATWHACCVAAWKLWIAPSDQGAILRKLQRRRCPDTGQRLLKTAEVDHRMPLFRVWRDHRHLPWPSLLGFWGLPNLQAINRPTHALKCAAEAGDRASRARTAAVSLSAE
jgi:hypothetical protein